MLLDPVKLGPRTAPNRVLFGPHETNLARGRALSERHIAYYERRAAGGAGVVVCEDASVHSSDWPYERAPLASACAEGWAGIAAACRPHGALVVAGLGHAGGQGSSAYSQAPLWAPSRVPEVNTREVPKWMEDDDIEAVVDGFGAAARLAAEAGLDGVEVNAGQHSLVRQFLSGLTNHRGDEWGTDRTKFLRDALGAARRAIGPDRLLGLRLSCDELAPWAGITPETAAVIAADVAPLVDYLVVVRGSIFTVGATRPDMHTESGFNAALCRSIRDAITVAGRGAGGASFGAPAVVLQGSVVDSNQAEWAISDRVCDVVEMTRAQIADADLVAKVRAGVPERVRPCLLCNQTCQVRDARNPLVTCVVDPRAGHETEDPPVDPSIEQRGAASDSPVDPATKPTRAGSWAPKPPITGPTHDVVVVGGGPAGLETARVAAQRGHRVRLVEQVGYLGGSVPAAAVARGRERLAVSVEWLAAECRRLGVDITLNAEADAEAVVGWQAEGAVVVLATGSRKGDRPYEIGPGAAGRVRSARKVLSKRYDAQREGGPGGDARGGRPDEGGEGPVVVLDPIGGPIGVSVAETFAADGRAVHLVTQDNIAGNELARTGDLAPANTRLQQMGVTIERRSLPRRVERRDRTGTHGDPGDARRSPDHAGPAEGATLDVVMEDRFTGQQRKVGAALVVDAGYRLPDTSLYEATGSTLTRVGDAVAPRTIHEAILEARRAVLAIEANHQ